jgi:large repetitive protein
MRGRRLSRILVCLAMVAMLLLASSASGKVLSSKLRNWPNTPLHHTLRTTLPNTVPSFAANLRGNVATAGNTLATCPENTPGARRRAHRRAATAAEVCLSASNNDHNMIRVNVDASDGHFNSSSATLTVPAGARVARAFLYWAADLSRGVQRDPNSPGFNGPADNAPGGDSTDNNPLYTTALMRVGSGASYSTIDATAPNRNGRWDHIPSWYQQPGTDPGTAYQVRADVTPEVNAGLAAATPDGNGNESVPVTVADVQAGRGYNRYGGWNLVVVWTTTTAPWRNVTLFDGFDFVQVQGGQQLVVGPLNFTGFQTPESGPVDAHVTVWATEGDRGITGDYMALGKLSDTCDGLAHQTDAAHPIDNFFNSSISDAGQQVGGRVPAWNNQLGFDLTTLKVPEGTIPNGATGASVCLGSVGDTYFFGGLVFTSLIRAPNLAISKSTVSSTASPGDTVNYTVTVSNPSTRPPGDPLFGTPVDAATNVNVADPIPSGLNAVTLVDDGGGRCKYLDGARSIVCDVGTLSPDATFTFTYRATVSAAAQGDTPGPLVNTACYRANSEDQPDVSYTGCDDASVVVPPSPPPPSPQPADLGVVKTVSHNIVNPGDTLTWHVVGTNYGPDATAGFVLADQLPAGVQFVSATASPDMTCTTPAVGQSGAISCTAAESVPPASNPNSPDSASQRELTIVATVPPATADGANLFNVATVIGDEVEPTPDPHPNRDFTQTLVVVPDSPTPPIPPYPPNPMYPPQPGGPIQPPVVPVHPPKLPKGPAGTRLTLAKSARPGIVRRGQRITYRLRVHNIAEADALHVRVCDKLPRGVVLADARGFRRSGGSVCAPSFRLRVLRFRTLRFTVRVTASRAGKLINHARVTSANAPTRRARATTRVLPPPPLPPPVTG